MSSSSRWALLAVVGLAGCPDYDFTRILTVDTFQQERMNAVDLLVIVDNSCSMVEEQDNLSVNFDALISTFAGAEVDWRIGVTSTDVETERYRGILLGGDDEILVRGPSGEIDRIEYNRSWGFEKGRSLSLSATSFSLASNDSPGNWCVSQASYSDGHYGTPGERNPACSGADPEVPTGGTDDGPRAPVAQDLVISEVMAMSAQTGTAVDSRCEWIELTNLTDDTLDLSGVLIADLGRHSFDRPVYDDDFGPAVLPTGTRVAPYDAIVIGRATSDNCGTPVDVAFERNFTLNDDLRYIEPTTPDAEEVFGEQVAQGTVGAGIEMGLEAARLVFEPPYSEQNTGFLRDEASLAILVVSDENDVSPYPVDAYLRYFAELKGDRGYRDPGAFSLSAVVGKDPPSRSDLPACQSDNGVAFYGERYLVAANETGGLAESICDEDFTPIVSRLGLTLSGLSQEFELSETPNREQYFNVELFSPDDTVVPVASTHPEEHEGEDVRQLVEGEDFVYDAERNVVRFDGEHVPPSQWFVVVKYYFASTVSEVAP